MEKKGYRKPIKASLEEILERNAQINEIKERFDKLRKISQNLTILMILRKSNLNLKNIWNL